MADCLWDGQVLTLSQTNVARLPDGILEILRTASNTQYLDTLAELGLEEEWTESIFTAYQPLMIDLAGRWLLRARKNGSQALRIASALAKLAPFCPQLAIYLQDITAQSRYGIFQNLGPSAPPGKVSDLTSGDLTRLLVLLYRLLKCDNHGFSSLISPVQMQVLFSHPELHIRYLAVQIMDLFFHFTTKATAHHLERICGKEPLEGFLDAKKIDFNYFKSWENDRLLRISKLLNSQAHPSAASTRVLGTTDLCSSVLDLAGFLAPRLDTTPASPIQLIACETARQNLRNVAAAICTSRATLVTGAAGSGKTAMVEEIAAQLGQSSKMLTLHLNSQTDGKLLIGLYTSGAQSGSFKWQPGVLTTAVLEGRWVFIEDLDRAPAEVMSVILPLLDSGELTVPNLGGTIQAAPGFKLIATIRATTSPTGQENSVGDFLGARHWTRVSLNQYSHGDLEQIIKESFPLLHVLSDKYLQMYQVLRQFLQRTSSNHSGLRSIGLQDLLQFCARSEQLFKDAGMSAATDAFPEAINSYIYLEAIDAFAGSLVPGDFRSNVAQIIARELQISADTARFCIELRVPTHERNANVIKYGRAQLPLKNASTKTRLSRQTKRPFAQTNHILKSIESIAASVKCKIPCLLVGETGTGKTTVIQELAEAVGQKLFVVNLSQQSEAGDLLGGFKPVTLKALAMPIKDEFDTLFDDTLKSGKNEKFIGSLDRNFTRGEWAKVLRLWQEACKTATTTLQAKIGKEENPTKKRKLNTSKYQDLKNRWDRLTTNLEVFRKHLESGSKGFAFTFMEGNLIKAVRRGDWILLDEINLATPDTLDSLADLLQSNSSRAPSILLSETGDVQRIEAHPDFRIFAAMNPATDVGKKELPASIRSRFAEYHISSCEDDFESLLQICTAYLGEFTHSDRWIAQDVAKLYQAVRALENQNRLVDGAGQKPHFTLRTLTRTLTYAIDIASTYGLRRSLYEGFSMSFLTLLDRMSISLVTPLIYQHLLASQKNVKSILHQIPKCPGNKASYVQFRHYWMAKGQFEVTTQPQYIITPFVEANLLNLVRATSTRRYPVLLQGPTSSGKTSMVEYLANISGNKFVRINNHEHTDLQEYFGTYVSGPDGLQFEDGVLVQALREGHWLVLDELNLAPTDILEALNRLLDDNRELLVPETQEIVRPHPNFMLFATQNPPGLYGGRKILSRAFRNRFLELHFDDIPEDELETILKERSQIAPSYCARIVAVYKKLAILRQSNRLFEQKNSFATLRDLFRWALRDAGTVEELAKNGFMLLGERVRNSAEREAVKSVIEEVMRVKIDENNLYALSTEQKRHIQNSGDLSQSISMTSSMSRLYVLVSKALQHKEPVLLIGDTGCGKTTICQVIAEVLGTQLHILNAHQNTEAGDIIGAQRPVRTRQQTSAELSTLLQELHATMAENHTLAMSQDQLIKWYEELPVSQKDSIPELQRYRIDELIVSSKALFEWADGILVAAMRSGHHFLLDEISLADDSVLERLNSVLEPSRTILLAEKGSIDATVTAHEGFQFLATMNPGGDYGKKELSPALRNRFTEIWVPELSRDDDILEILQAKLPASPQQLAQPILQFARWFDEHCGENKAGVSLRQILAWIDFLKLPHINDPANSIVHGAALVYIDGIGADPAAKLFFSQDDIKTKKLSCLVQLEHLFQVPARKIYSIRNPRVTIDDSGLIIDSFTIPRVSSTTENTDFSLTASTTIKNALRVVRGLQIPKPILIEGSPGVGKTSLVEAIAHMVGMSLTRINLSDQTDLMDLFGSDVPVENGSIGQFEWRDAPFLTAMQKGEWVLLDEMNLASQSVLEGLNACLDHRGQVFIPELERSFTKHSNFVLFAAQNPHAQGGGRKGLPASFVNRFTVVYAESLTEDDIVQICTAAYPGVPSETISDLASYVSKLNTLVTGPQAMLTNGGPWEFNLRDVLRWLSLISKTNSALSVASPGDFEEMLVLGRLRTPEDRRIVSTNLSPSFLSTSRSRTRYLSSGTNFLQCGFAFLQKSHLSNKTFELTNQLNLPVLESLMVAVEQNWPCLLVGPSGCGKSSTLQGLASAYGATIISLAVNNEMDTMDLLGGYEQVDSKRHVQILQAELKDEIRHLSSLNISESELSSLLSLWQHVELQDFHGLKSLLATPNENSERFEQLNRLANTLVELKAQTATADYTPRFEWIDGPLIRAMEAGHWLILDNVNLCNASVLDRLNALLEPKGILSVNEHRSVDGSPKIINRHSGFRLFLTMDPRHGELSRAMRNRCVELYMAGPAQTAIARDVLDHDPQQETKDFLSRFDWPTFDDDQTKVLLAIGSKYLSIQHHQNSTAWLAQVAGGLHSLPQSTISVVGATMTALRSACDAQAITTAIPRFNLSFLETCAIKDIERQSIEVDLAIDPTVNTAIATFLTKSSHHHDNFQTVIDLVDVRFQLAQLSGRFQNLQIELHQKSPNSLTRLDRSLLSSSNRKYARESTSHVAGLLNSMLHGLQQQLGTMSDQNSRDYCRHLIHLCSDLLDLVISLSFDEGLFLGYIREFFSFLQTAAANDGPELVLSVVKQGLAPYGNMDSHQTMESLWKFFKPVTARSLIHLDDLNRLETLACRLEQTFWRSAASVEFMIDLSQLVSDLGSQSIDLLQGRLQELESLIVEAETSQEVGEASIRPYFQAQFRLLKQYKELSEDFPAPERWRSLLLLSGHSMLDADLGARTDHEPQLFGLQRAAGNPGHSDYLGAIRGDLAASLTVKMNGVDLVPLRGLSRLYEEIGFLAQEFATDTTTLVVNQYDNLCDLLGNLMKELLAAQSQLIDPKSFQEWSNYLECIREPSALRPQPLRLATSTTAQESLATPALRLGRSFEQILEVLKEEPIPSDTQRWTSLGKAWMAFALVSLHLYLPEYPFDPALTSKIKHQRWQNRQHEITTEIWANKTYESAIPGHPTDFRQRILHERLGALGDEPHALEIVRPEKSQIVELHTELVTVQRTILNPFRDANEDINVLTSDVLSLTEIRRQVRANIARLSNSYREYKDITTPAIGFLRCLDIGASLVLLTDQSTTVPWTFQASILTSDNVHSSRSPPSIFGVQLQKVFQIVPPQSIARGLDFLDYRYLRLSLVVVQRNLWHDSSTEDPTMVTNIFEHFYQEWKSRLSKEQDQKALQSSLYHFKGSEEEPEQQEAEMLNLFPTYDSEADSLPASTDANKVSPAELAKTLSDVQAQIFASPGNNQSALLDFLVDLQNRIVKSSPCSETAFYPFGTLEFLPGILSKLHPVHKTLRESQVSASSPDFYRKANLTEAQKLIVLTRKIKTRYREILKTWPDHFTLHNVLQTIEHVLDQKHSEPLAKLIPIVEKLHDFMDQWQRVTSSEFSAGGPYDELTQLLISWRRLELATWSHLLDREEENHAQDAKSWWFIAYEAILHPIVEPDIPAEEMQRFAEELSTQLHVFLRTTTCGQFSSRLEMLKVFQKHAAAQDQVSHNLRPVVSTLAHCIAYFSRWEGKIQDDLKQRRASLDKKMKDAILLASWKDTNIAALRASARRSHNSLFKIVKKYRDTLSSPVKSLLASPSEAKAIDLTKATLRLSEIQDDITDAIGLVQSRADPVDAQSRLNNPYQTVKLMARVGQNPYVEFDAQMYLVSFHSNLQETIKSLQRETPATLTEETKLMVKHLKTRKRNLLADTLKELRQMGIRSNLNMEILSAQSDTTKLLAQNSHESRLNSSAHDYYRFLDDLTQVRGNAREHSSDLSPNDAARCIGFAEGLLYQIRKQRREICDSLAEIDDCDSTLDLLRSIWQPAKYSVVRTINDTAPCQDLINRVHWIVVMLNSAAQLVTMIAKLSGNDYTAAHTELMEHEAKTAELVAVLEQNPDISCLGLGTTLDQEYVQRVSEHCSAVKKGVKRLIEHAPDLGFFLTHVLPWLNLELSLDEALIIQSSTSSTVQQHLSKANGTTSLDFETVVKQMLVGMQYFKNTLTGLPASHEESGWLSKHDSTIHTAGKGLQPRSILLEIKKNLSNMTGRDQSGMELNCAKAALLLPILQQYRNSFACIINKRISLHTTLCSLAGTLSSSLREILSQGFCTPKESSKGEQGKAENEGVGLGEGEGAEDISKDVQEDEDISELAQGAQKDKDQGKDEHEMGKEHNAVDLGDEDLEGQFDAEDDERDENEADDKDNESGDDGLDEEVGEVDELDPSAVDEKMWQDEADKDQREKKGKAKGKQQDDDTGAQDQNEAQSDETSNAGDDGPDVDEHPLESKTQDQLDPHVDEADNLDLPEDMQMDGDKTDGPEDDLIDGLSDLEDMSDNSEEDKAVEEDAMSDSGDIDNEQNVEQTPEDGDVDIEGEQITTGKPDNGEADDTEHTEPETQIDQMLTQNDAEANDNNNDDDDVIGSGHDANQQDSKEDEALGDARTAGATSNENQVEYPDAAKVTTKTGDIAENEADMNAKQQDGEQTQSQQQQGTDLPPAFRKLGEALQRWRRVQQIQESSQDQPANTEDQMEDVQHLQDENDKSDAQVLGPAAENEVHALDKDELDMEVDAAGPEADEKVNGFDADSQDVDMEDAEETTTEKLEAGETFIGQRDAQHPSNHDNDLDKPRHHRAQSEQSLDSIEEELSEVQLSSATTSLPTFQQAQTLWQQCESITRDLSLSLTEQLRLILAPSLATKMRGDFRTGKRLNIKRIIPYIASGYKRDKIWMRRSVPSKRSYQVMLALDDSESMAESGASKLALEALALLTRSLSMLEVGQIAVASFGSDFKIAHGFEQQFSTEAAVRMVQQFSFGQKETNVLRLMSKSLDTFREARAKQTSSSSDLWQLQLIISDGACSDHESIRQLVRQAHSERIMIVFAIINSADNRSVLNMTSASFEPDENGETKLKMKSYMDGFPFPYYLIVGDIRNLPGVLAMALRQWFAEVVESG